MEGWRDAFWLSEAIGAWVVRVHPGVKAETYEPRTLPRCQVSYPHSQHCVSGSLRLYLCLCLSLSVCLYLCLSDSLSLSVTVSPLIVSLAASLRECR